MFSKNMGNLMKQAQKVQQQMMKLQEELNAREVSIQTGGGMVEAVVNGKGELLRLSIEKEVINPNDAEMLVDLIVAAVIEAQRRAQEMAHDEMNKLTGGVALANMI